MGSRRKSREESDAADDAADAPAIGD